MPLAFHLTTTPARLPEQVRRVARHVTPSAQHDDALLERIVSASSFGAMKRRHEADPDNEAMRNAGEASD